MHSFNAVVIMELGFCKDMPVRSCFTDGDLPSVWLKRDIQEVRRWDTG